VEVLCGATETQLEWKCCYGEGETYESYERAVFVTDAPSSATERNVIVRIHGSYVHPICDNVSSHLTANGVVFRVRAMQTSNFYQSTNRRNSVPCVGTSD